MYIIHINKLYKKYYRISIYICIIYLPWTVWCRVESSEMRMDQDVSVSGQENTFICVLWHQTSCKWKREGCMNKKKKEKNISGEELARLRQQANDVRAAHSNNFFASIKHHIVFNYFNLIIYFYFFFISNFVCILKFIFFYYVQSTIACVYYL